MPSKLQITRCNNELRVIAYTSAMSYEIANIKSGNGNTVNVTINIEAGAYTGGVQADGVNNPLNLNETINLPAGSYDMVAAGYNWGGTTEFKFYLDEVPFGSNIASTDSGLVYFTPPISRTI